MAETMKALVYNPEGLDKMTWATNFSVPEISSNEFLVKTTATSLNPFDFRVTESASMFTGYKNTPVGCDMAGTIVKIGKNVEGFQVGDKVFGWGAGLAEFCVSDPTRIAKIPPGKKPPEDFSIFPCVAVTAWQLLHKYWIAKPGFQVSSIAVMGAAGAVGSCLIQMARDLGGPELEIFALSSPKNEEYLKSIGASHFIDYSSSRFDISKSAIPEKSVDLIIDLVSGISEDNFVANAMCLIRPNTGKYITLNTLSSMEDVERKIKTLSGISLSENYDLFMVHRIGSSRDLGEIANMVADGKLKLNIAEDLPWNEQAIRSGFNKLKLRHHARGKFRVVISP